MFRGASQEPSTGVGRPRKRQTPNDMQACSVHRILEALGGQGQWRLAALRDTPTDCRLGWWIKRKLTTSLLLPVPISLYLRIHLCPSLRALVTGHAVLDETWHASVHVPTHTSDAKPVTVDKYTDKRNANRRSTNPSCDEGDTTRCWIKHPWREPTHTNTCFSSSFFLQGGWYKGTSRALQNGHFGPRSCPSDGLLSSANMIATRLSR
ncbi:hypothetical protein LZ30DRAFT_363060 [Colletotrichum cereale]|nr:hypothetical protein LZ30DRAFT_363060 [Colletotrichum cereale]